MANKSPPSGGGGGGMDFMLRTAREREASNKRKIRPKLIDDDLLPEDSDDSDFNLGSEEESGDENSADSSSGSESDSEEENNSEEDSSENDEAENNENSKSSTLKDALKKLNELDVPTKSKKRKKPAAKKAKADVNGTESTSEVDGLQNSTADGVALNGPTNPKKPKKSAPSKSKSKKGSKSTSESKPKAKKKKESKKSQDRNKGNEKRNKSNSVFQRISNLEALQTVARPEINLDVRICSFCLGDKSDSSNEIVECDSCGITVHEACYGVSDNISIASGTESSNSTEPWFCDACKTGTTVSCDLCPITDGLLKETNTGRFVHLICAMYTPGVRVLDDGTPDLREVPYTNWGSYNCAVCNDERQARTGIAIRCDAGFCKTYVHATCAQRHGFLSDPNAVDPANQIADPYFASCKLHSVKKLTRKRAKSFGILQEQIRIRQQNKNTLAMTDVEKAEQSRIQKKIEKVRAKQSEKFGYNSRIELPNHFEEPSASLSVMTTKDTHHLKKTRLVDASTTVDRFMVKAALAGENIKSLELEDKNERIIANIGKKWNVLPALTVEYAAYYADREARVTSLIEQCEKLEQHKSELVDMHAGVKNAFEDMSKEHLTETEEGDKLTKSLEQLHEILSLLHPSIKFPKTTSSKKRRPSGSPSRKSPPSKRDRRSPSTKRKSKSKPSPINGSQSPSGRLRILRCDVCGDTDDQHLITRCDRCKRCFHLKCLDPPLTRMPKRTKSFGWMCSDCGDESEESDQPQVDTEAPRALRGREKLKKPNKYLGVAPAVVNGTSKSMKGSQKEKHSSTSPKNTSATFMHDSDASACSSLTEGRCHNCSKEDFKKNLVMCDKCYTEFHFGCLNPPLRYTPKRRGYSWFCDNCDEGSPENSPQSLKIPAEHELENPT